MVTGTPGEDNHHHPDVAWGRGCVDHRWPRHIPAIVQLASLLASHWIPIDGATGTHRHWPMYAPWLQPRAFFLHQDAGFRINVRMACSLSIFGTAPHLSKPGSR